MRNPKLEKERGELARRLSTLGDLRKTMPPGTKKILVGAENEPDVYPILWLRASKSAMRVPPSAGYRGISPINTTIEYN